jgi:hypothetical protein
MVKEFGFKIGGSEDVHYDCKHFGQVKYKKEITVPGCTLKYDKWLKFSCRNCRDYEKKGGKKQEETG